MRSDKLEELENTPLGVRLISDRRRSYLIYPRRGEIAEKPELSSAGPMLFRDTIRGLVIRVLKSTVDVRLGGAGRPFFPATSDNAQPGWSKTALPGLITYRRARRLRRRRPAIGSPRVRGAGAPLFAEDGERERTGRRSAISHQWVNRGAWRRR